MDRADAVRLAAYLMNPDRAKGRQARIKECRADVLQRLPTANDADAARFNTLLGEYDKELALIASAYGEGD